MSSCDVGGNVGGAGSSGREGLFEAVDFFGDGAEAGGVVVGVAVAGFVADDGEAFTQSGGERG